VWGALVFEQVVWRAVVFEQAGKYLVAQREEAMLVRFFAVALRWASNKNKKGEHIIQGMFNNHMHLCNFFKYYHNNMKCVSGMLINI
jgi:hypothetical protein